MVEEDSVAGIELWPNDWRVLTHAVDGIVGERPIKRRTFFPVGQMLLTRVPTRSSDGESIPHSERASQMFTDRTSPRNAPSW